MRSLINRLLTNLQLSLYRSSEVARVDGIILSSLREKPAAAQFKDTMLAGLRLLAEVDSRRYRRVTKNLSRIVDRTLSQPGLAQYQHRLKSCDIDFLQPSATYDEEYLIGWCATVLVHESTHGVVRNRGILYTKKLRTRIERLCVREEQRFVTRLIWKNPDLAGRLYREFRAADWKKSWNTSRAQRLWAELRRTLFPDREG